MCSRMVTWNNFYPDDAKMSGALTKKISRRSDLTLRVFVLHAWYNRECRAFVASRHFSKEYLQIHFRKTVLRAWSKAVRNAEFEFRSTWLFPLNPSNLSELFLDPFYHKLVLDGNITVSVIPLQMINIFQTTEFTSTDINCVECLPMICSRNQQTW